MPTTISDKHYKFSKQVTKLVRKYFTYGKKCTNTYTFRDTTKYLSAVPKNELSLHTLCSLLPSIKYFLECKYDPDYSESTILTKQQLAEKKALTLQRRKDAIAYDDKLAQKLGFKNNREYNKFIRDNDHQPPEWWRITMKHIK